MKKSWIVIVLVAVGLVVAGSSFANVAKRHAMRGELGGALAMRALAGIRGDLDLTDEQVIELRHIAKRVRAENEAARDGVRANLKDAAQLLLANPDDVEGAKAMLARNEAAKETLRENVLGGISDALKVLTPEQRSMISTRLDALTLPSGIE